MASEMVPTVTPRSPTMGSMKRPKVWRTPMLRLSTTAAAKTTKAGARQERLAARESLMAQLSTAPRLPSNQEPVCNDAD